MGIIAPSCENEAILAHAIKWAAICQLLTRNSTSIAATSEGTIIISIQTDLLLTMHVAVVPASSSTCTEAIRQLLGDKSSPSVTGIYRNLAKVPSEFASHPNFKAVKGDVNDGNSLDFTGCDAVLTLTPPTYDDTDIIKHANDVSQTVKSAVQKASSVKRLVYVSSVGAEFAEGVVSCLSVV